MAYRNSYLHQLSYALEKRADFLEDAKDWIADNPELSAGLMGGLAGGGVGALIPTGEGGGAGTRARNALIGALLGGGGGWAAEHYGNVLSDYMNRLTPKMKAGIEKERARRQADADSGKWPTKDQAQSSRAQDPEHYVPVKNIWTGETTYENRDEDKVTGRHLANFPNSTSETVKAHHKDLAAAATQGVTLIVPGASQHRVFEEQQKGNMVDVSNFTMGMRTAALPGKDISALKLYLGDMEHMLLPEGATVGDAVDVADKLGFPIDHPLRKLDRKLPISVVEENYNRHLSNLIEQQRLYDQILNDIENETNNSGNQISDKGWRAINNAAKTTGEVSLLDLYR